MKEKTEFIETQDTKPGKVKNPVRTSERLNLNHLMERIKLEEKEKRKYNLIIISSTISVAVIVLIILSLL